MSAQTYTDAQGHRQHFERAGQGETLLLIHGSLCDYRYWRWQTPAFSQNHQVVAPSLRGYWPEAFTAEDDTFSIARHSSDLQALIHEISPGRPVHILGHSRGAHVALDLACSAPQLVRSLSLADPGFRFTHETESVSFHAEAVRQLEQGEVDAALAGFIDRVSGPGTWRQMVGWFKTMVKDNAYTLLSQIREMNLAVDLEKVRSLQCPLLLIGGANSPARYGSRLDILQQALPRASRVTIPMASHGMNLGNAKAFNLAVAQFMEQDHS